MAALKTSATPSLELGSRKEHRYSDNPHQTRPFGLNFSFRAKRGKQHRADQQKRTEQNRQARAAWSNSSTRTADNFPQLVKA